VRQEQVMISKDEIILQTGDHVIVLLLKKRYVRQLETLFQVTLNFMD